MGASKGSQMRFSESPEHLRVFSGDLPGRFRGSQGVLWQVMGGLRSIQVF